jgi:hypothetical protein
MNRTALSTCSTLNRSGNSESEGCKDEGLSCNMSTSTTSVVRDGIAKILNLISSSKLLEAKKVYDELKNSDDVANSPDLRKEIEANEEILEMLRREHDARELLKIGEVDDSWILGATLFGVNTHYKMSGEEIIIRLEGELDDLPLFEQLAVVHEVDLFSEWIPFCNGSKAVTKLGPAEIIA